MKYLVTGAAGFIGAHLTHNLIKSGHEVHAIDNFNDYYDPSLKFERVKSLISPLGGSVTTLDIREPGQIESILTSHEFDSVIHLAAQPGVRIPISEYLRYIDSNLTGFSNVLTKVCEYEIPNFLYASSSSVYGNINDIEFSESANELNPVSFYGATKLTNEILAGAIVRNTKTRARGMRFFTVYGPWGRPDMAYFRLIASVLSDYKFKKFGSGSTLRDFTYIADVIEAITKLDIELSSHTEGFSDIVNVGGGEPHSLNEMIQTLEEILEIKIESELEESNPNDVIRTCASSTYLRSLINTVPKTELIHGLGEVVKWSQVSENKAQLRYWAQSVQ